MAILIAKRRINPVDAGLGGKINGALVDADICAELPGRTAGITGINGGRIIIKDGGRTAPLLQEMAVGSQFENAVIFPVGDIDIAVCVEIQIGRMAELVDIGAFLTADDG